MKRIALVILLGVAFLTGCATSDEGRVISAGQEVIIRR